VIILKNTIIQVLSLVPVVGVCIYSYYLKFSNPDMTSTRLIMTYWKQELIMLGILIACSIVYNYAKIKEDKEMNKMLDKLNENLKLR
jgi:hypothetical protein